MGRKRNTAERNRIASIAFTLFRNNGYKNTTYVDIAKAADTQPTNIQYYYPRKEQFLEVCLKQMLNICAEIVLDSYPDLSPLDQINLIAYLACYYFYFDDLLHDISDAVLENRQVSIHVINDISDWCIQFVKLEDPEMQLRLKKAQLYALGAGSEYLYYSIHTNTSFDPDEIIQIEAQISGSLLNLPFSNPADLVSHAWLSQKCRIVREKLINPPIS